MRLTIHLLAASTCLALAGCGSGAGNGSDTVDEGASVGAAPATEAADEPAPSAFGDDTGAPANSAAPAGPPCPEGAQCFGSLVVSAEPFVFTRSDRELSADGTVTIKSRGGPPVLVAALKPAVLSLDNGYKLSVNTNYASNFAGMMVCRDDGKRCFEDASDEFRQIAAGDSPARLNLTFSNYVDSNNQSSLPGVETGNIALRFYAVRTGESGRVIEVSLPNVAITNQIKR